MYQSILFLSRVPIVSKSYLITKENLAALIKWLQCEDINRGSPVKITNSNTKSSTSYRSITTAAKDIAIGWNTISNAIKNNTVVNNYYTFKTISKEEYLQIKLPAFISDIRVLQINPRVRSI